MSARREARRAQVAAAELVLAGVQDPDELRDADAVVWHNQKQYRRYMTSRDWTMPSRDRLDGLGGASPANRRRAAAKAWATQHGIDWDWARSELGFVLGCRSEPVPVAQRPPAVRSVQQGGHGALMGITTKTAAGTDPIHQLLHRLLIFAAAESLHQVDPALSTQLRKILEASRDAARSPDPRPAPPPLPSKDEQAVDGERPHLFKHPDQLLTKAEFCRWAGVPDRTLSQWITEGTAPRRMRFGRHVRIRCSDALAWAESRYVND